MLQCGRQLPLECQGGRNPRMVSREVWGPSKVWDPVQLPRAGKRHALPYVDPLPSNTGSCVRLLSLSF